MQKESEKPEEAEGWADDLAHADSPEQFFRSLTLFLVGGKKFEKIFMIGLRQGFCPGDHSDRS